MVYIKKELMLRTPKMQQQTWIIGAGGIGSALRDALVQKGEAVSLISRASSHNNVPEKVISLNYNCEKTIADFVHHHPTPHSLIITSGLLHDDEHQPEKTIKQVQDDWLLKSIEANVYPSLYWLKALSAEMKPASTIKIMCFSAKVGSITDNRLGGWYSYRLSKAMLNMLVKNTAIEWRYRFPKATVISYHPGTVATPLSAPFSQNVQHRILTPSEAAEHCLSLQKQLTPEMSGNLYDWQGKNLPF